MLSCARTLDGETLDTVEYAYDALGRMVSKSVGGKVAESYEYDIRGWAKAITATRDTSILFSEAIRFEAPQMPGTAALYSGNISEIETVQYGKATDIYAYSYDGFSRLSDARHFIGGASGASNTDTERLMEYDLNGNRTLDSRTGLEFTHNLLNLPCEVRDSQDNMRLRYTYLSDGTKVSALDAAGDGLLYRGSFVYDRNGSNVNLESVAWDEGRIGAQPFQDQWFVKDHLGNVRSVINLSKDSDAPVSDVILEQNDYLPYGTKASDVSTPALSGNRYRYAGKEEQRFGTFDSQLLDFGARYYDPWSCQWTAVDPMAEKYYRISAYNYCKDTPMNRVDPDGLTDYFDSSGAMVYRDLVNNGEIRIVTSNQAKDILEGNLSKGNVEDLNNGINQKLYESSETFTGDLRSSAISYDSALNIVNHYCESEVVIGDLKLPNDNGNRGSFGTSYGGDIIADFDVIQTDGLITRTQNGITVSEEALYDNSNNIKSSVDDHERFHQSDPIKDNKREHRAYEYQVNAPGFKNTTSRFQSKMNERSKQYGN